MQKYLVLDYETRSEADLKRVGAFEYSVHPSTQVLCVAWRLGTRDDFAAQSGMKGVTKVWSPAFPSPFGELIRSLCDPEITIVAHNALFEQVITANVLSRIIHLPGLKTIPVSRWICTASLAAALALPRKLEHACQAIRLPIQKDMEGNRLVLKYCKPRKPTKTNAAKWHSSADDLRRIMQYCATDVDAEVELFLAVPPLNPFERRLWELDQRMNLSGFKVDRPMVKNALKMIAVETTRLQKEAVEITKGEIASLGQRDKVLAWVAERNTKLPDLRAKTVADALRDGEHWPEVRRLLEIRQVLSKTSTKKYLAAEMRSRHDGRVRDILMYHAASTGRWGGMGFQPHNLPRGTLKTSTDAAAEVIREGDLELVRLLYGEPMEAFSSCLRSTIVPSEGCEFFCTDWNAIEVRKLFWLAKHEAGLQAYREERDLYREQAVPIYKLAAPEDADFTQRDVAKRAVLGCGFGMGWETFQASCALFGNPVDDETAQIAVKAYRETHAPVVKLWGNYERAAIAAVQNRGKRYAINRTVWYVSGDFLYCELPSKRRLAYYGPTIRYERRSKRVKIGEKAGKPVFKRDHWGEPMPKLYHWGVDPKTKKWVNSGTYGGRLTENVVQASARDVMAEAMLRSEASGYRMVITVHDEELAERPIGTGTLEEFEKIAAQVPAWAEGLPLKVGGWKGTRYRK